MQDSNITCNHQAPFTPWNFVAIPPWVLNPYLCTQVAAMNYPKTDLVNRTQHWKFTFCFPHLPCGIQNSSPSDIFTGIIGASQAGGVGSGQHQDPHLPGVSMMKTNHGLPTCCRALFACYLLTYWVIVGVNLYMLVHVNHETKSTSKNKFTKRN